jgi:hypothetical protein
LLGRGVRSQGWSGLLTYLCRNTLCWEREVQESGVEWSLNISLQEHIHSSVKASCLLALWHFKASPGGHVLWSCLSLYRIWGPQCFHGEWGTWLILSSDPPDPTSPPSETITQLLLRKRGYDSSSHFLLVVEWKKEDRCRGTHLRRWPMWSPGDSDRTGWKVHE